MLFNSREFLIFFPIVVFIYFVVPKKIKPVWLLAVSYYFYMCWNPRYILLIALSTVVTFLSGWRMDAIARAGGDAAAVQRRKKWVVAGSFIINLAILGFFKYYGFFLNNLNALLRLAHLRAVEDRFNVVLPVGISFYTFQALSYTMDVYRGDVPAEKSLLKYALFVSFFPQLVAGPIERSGNLLRDIGDIPNKKLWDYSRITRGLTLMLYGFFLKLVIADRVSAVVDVIFDRYAKCSGPTLWIGAAAFALQIYCDFASYSTIAIGAARVMGFTLMENFDTPYFSRSIQEFWRRWHISLSTWFRDYLYIPLGGSRCSARRRYFNLMVVFLVSGLWHGAGWHFVAWGCLHGLYQIVGGVTRPLRDRAWRALRVSEGSKLRALVQTGCTVLLVTVAWVFFRADSLGVAAAYLKRMLTNFGGVNFGVLWQAQAKREWLVLGASACAVLAVSLIRYNRRQNLDAFLAQRPLPVRWLALYALLFAVVIFGRYGQEFSEQAFIYFQF